MEPAEYSREMESRRERGNAPTDGKPDMLGHTIAFVQYPIGGFVPMFINRVVLHTVVGL